MKYSRPLSIAVSVVLIAATLPVFLAVSALSFMAFDAPDAASNFMPWAVVGGVVGISILVPLLCLIGSIKMIRRGKIPAGLGISILPGIVIGIFWLWLSQQSFS